MKLKLIIILSMISTIFFAQKKDEISIVRNKQLQLQNQENALDFKRLEEDLQGEKKQIEDHLISEYIHILFMIA